MSFITKIFILIIGTVSLSAMSMDTVGFPTSLDKQAGWVLTKDAKFIMQGKTVTLDVDVIKKNDDNISGAYHELDVAQYAGKTITFSADFKKEDLEDRKYNSFEPKIILDTLCAGRNKYSYSHNVYWGKGGWINQVIVTKIPKNIEKLRVYLGLKKSGKFYVRNFRIHEGELYKVSFTLPEDFKCEYSKKVKNWPRYRGIAMQTRRCTIKDLHDVKKLGVNVIRWWIIYDVMSPSYKGLDKSLDKMELFAKECQKLGLKLIPVLCNPPGDRYGKPEILGENTSKEVNGINTINMRIYFEKKYLDAYLEVWKKIAKRFKGNPGILAYSVLNEPTQMGVAQYSYLECQYLAAQAIREEDPDMPVVITANVWSACSAFSFLQPVPMRDIIYEAHSYQPSKYTHQGIREERAKKPYLNLLEYPKNYKGAKAFLEKIHKPVQKFQNKYGAIIYIGEFSVTRWSPGGYKWLNDSCAIFEENKWHWAYHTFREFHGWSLEHSSQLNEKGFLTSHKPATEPTKRMQVMKKYWDLNKK